jgi:guanylate kinase
VDRKKYMIEKINSTDLKGRLVIVTAPSGAGKTTIVKRLLASDLPLSFSVSACTRERRSGEVDGVDYYFIGKEAFEDKIANDAFVEFEEVYEGSFYGTLKSELQRLWKDERIVLFDIDVLGAINLKRQFKEQALTIFIQPPSLDILVERLTRRNTESEASLKKRIAKAASELTYMDKFDKTVLNDDLERACKEAYDLVVAFLK